MPDNARMTQKHGDERETHVDDAGTQSIPLLTFPIVKRVIFKNKKKMKCKENQ